MVDLEKLLSDDKFLDKVVNCKNDEEVKKAFKENGVDLTDEQMANIKTNLKKAAEDLSQEELSEVSGGLKKRYTLEVDSKVSDMANAAVAVGAFGGYLGWIRGALKARRTFRGGNQYDAFKHVFKSAVKGGLKGAAIGAGVGAAAMAVANTMNSGVRTSEEYVWD